MTKMQRIENIAVALLLIVFAIILITIPIEGYLIVFTLVSVSWLLQSIRLFFYYFTMARFMVGGRRVLLKATIFFDLALVLFSMSDIPKIYVMIYLVVGMIFVNMVEILRAMDAKRCGNHHWKFRMFAGITGIVLAVICLINYKSANLAGYIYAVELAYSAIVRIANSFRRTKIVYIQ